MPGLDFEQHQDHRTTNLTDKKETVAQQQKLVRTKTDTTRDQETVPAARKSTSNRAVYTLHKNLKLKIARDQHNSLRP